jgi:hypothetical protein
MAEKDFTVKNSLVVNTAFSVNSTALYYNGTAFANSTTISFGNNTVNTVVNSTGIYVNGSPFSDGGYYKGNDGVVGNTTSKGNLYRLNSNTQTANIVISSGENSLTVGPMVIGTGVNLTIEDGGRAVII